MEDLQNMAAEIRLRAERRAGELLAEMARTGQRAAKGDQKPMSRKSTLPELGISRNQSSQWQKVAAIPESNPGFPVTVSSNEARHILI
jgi:hypothetical protein